VILVAQPPECWNYGLHRCVFVKVTKPTLNICAFHCKFSPKVKKNEKYWYASEKSRDKVNWYLQLTRKCSKKDAQMW
jgi:hypothetical protein